MDLRVDSRCHRTRGGVKLEQKPAISRVAWRAYVLLSQARRRRGELGGYLGLAASGHYISRSVAQSMGHA